MQLAGLPVPAEAVEQLAALIRETAAEQLANRLEQALDDGARILALSIPERALMLNALDDPPTELAELRAVLLADFQWRAAEGLD